MYSIRNTSIVLNLQIFSNNTIRKLEQVRIQVLLRKKNNYMVQGNIIALNNVMGAYEGTRYRDLMGYEVTASVTLKETERRLRLMRFLCFFPKSSKIYTNIKHI